MEHIPIHQLKLLVKLVTYAKENTQSNDLYKIAADVLAELTEVLERREKKHVYDGLC